MDIALRCLSFSSNTHEECFVLVSPHSDRIISNQPYLRSHPGLKEKLCGGDLTLIFRHTPSLVDCDESIVEKNDSLNDLTPKDEGQEKDTLESLEAPKHQFILTQFYFPTRCSYCDKKVWTKVAFQCRTCARICHKKCIQNCTSYTQCVDATKSTSGWFSRQQCKPENEEPEKQQENKDSKESSGETIPNVTEASSESEPERLVTKPDKSSDEHEMKPTGKDDQTSDEAWQATELVFSNLPLEARKNKV
ncbi:PDZ domain-containing protein 8 [Desmophyllum pertusum]|uniref:PDZ domain-containing protein 8 n=1 Tax=Desmophyllum pertusum TaxID=174260 RepID=A0A9W9Z1I6_9CNID|nr:PDZ domain-containing protein 8 [Desmophyllum pertusum]